MSSNKATGTLHLAQPGLLALAWAGVGTAGLFVGLRCLIRIRISNKLSDVGWDDIWVLVAFLFLVVNAVLQTLQAPSLYFLVQEAEGLEPTGEALYNHGEQYVKYEFVIIAFFWTILWCIKASFLAMYYRLFDGLRKWRRCWWCVVVFTFLSYVGAWIASVWTCHPPSTYFQFGQCTTPIDERGSKISIIYSTTVDILTDLMIILLPMSLIWNIKITKSAKAGLVTVFSLGVLIMVVAIIRAVEIDGISYTDPVWLAVWGLVESSISVIVGCLPPFKSLIKFERSRSSAAAYRRKRDQKDQVDADASQQNNGISSFTLTDNISSSGSGPDQSLKTKGSLDTDEIFTKGSVLLSVGCDSPQ